MMGWRYLFYFADKGKSNQKSTYDDEVENRRNDFWSDLVSVLKRESVHIEYDHPSKYLSYRF